MSYYLVLFDFLLEYKQNAEDALKEHTQLRKKLKDLKAVQLNPTAFLLGGMYDVDELATDFVAWLDRGEDVLVFEIIPDAWGGYAQKRTLSQINKSFAQPPSPAPKDEYPDIIDVPDEQ